MDKGHRLFLLELMQEMVTCGRPATAARLRAAAERIRVLGEEVEAVRAHEHTVSMTGGYFTESREKVDAARAATDAARRTP